MTPVGKLMPNLLNVASVVHATLFKFSVSSPMGFIWCYNLTVSTTPTLVGVQMTDDRQQYDPKQP